MKKNILIITIATIFLFIYCISSFAVTPARIKNYIKSLEIKLELAKKTNDDARIKLLDQLIAEQKNRLIKKKVVKGKNQIEDLKDSVATLERRIKRLERKKKRSSATVSGRAYIAWSRDMMDASQGTRWPNNFDASRMYIDIKNELDRDVDVRFTTDIARDSSNINVYVKYCYFTLNKLDVPYIGLNSIRIGQSPTHWIDYMQKTWKFRYVAKVMTDQYKVFSSADMGLAGLGTINLADYGIPGLGSIDYHGTLMNGTGYKKAEDNSAKNIGLRLSTKPLSTRKRTVALALGAYVADLGTSSVALTKLTKILTGMASYSFSDIGKGLVFGEYTKGTKLNGFSLGGQVQVIPGITAFGRYDSLDQTSGSTIDKYSNITTGVEHDWGKNVKFALDYQGETKNGIDNNKMISIHSRVKW